MNTDENNNTNANNNNNNDNETLAFSFDYAKYRLEEQKRQDDDTAYLKAFLAELKQAGGSGVIVVSYNGYGDSGDCELEEISDANKQLMENLGYAFEYGGGYFRQSEDERKELTPEQIRKQSLLSMVSQSIPYDWYNNEGGYGTVTLNIDACTIFVNGEIRVESTEHFEQEL